MLFIAYSTLFSCFGKWDLMCEYHQCRIWTERSTLVGVMSIVLTVGRSCLDLGKIMVRLFSPCNTVVVCICYGLICSLVTVCNRGTCTLTGLVMHDHGTHALTELVVCELQASHESPNCQKMVHACFQSHVHPLHVSIHRP